MDHAESLEVGALGFRRTEIVVAFGVTLAFYLPTLSSYHAVWIAQPNTHGYLIALGTFWLTTRERSALQRVSPWSAPLLAAGAVSLLWLLAQIASLRFAVQGAVPILAVAWAAAVFGPGALRRLAPVGAVFLVAVPFWGVLTPVLRALTVTVTSALLGALSIPVTIEGPVITLEHGAFIIEDACAGLNYLLSGLAIGGLYAVGLVEGFRARAKIVGLAVALSVVANWIRVTSLIVIGHVSRMEASIIYDHGTFGWVVFFVFVLLLFFPMAHLIERRAPESHGPHRASVEPGSTAGKARARSALAVATISSVVGPLVYLAVGALPSRQLDDGLLRVAENWSPRVEADEAYAWRPAFGGADHHLTTHWSDGTSRVAVDHLGYYEQAQGAELIGYPNRIAPDSVLATHRLIGPTGPSRRYLNEAIIQAGDSFVLVWYWYRVGGIETASPLKAKLLEIPAFFRRIEVSELIAVSTACEPDSCVAAAATLRSFLGEA